MNAVRTRGLGKAYRDATAVRGLDLTVPRGTTFGFLGPNGAGKSTTIGMLCTLIRPTAGEASVAGQDINRAPHEVRRRIGLVTQESTVDQDLSAIENLSFHAELYGASRRDARRRAGAVLEIMHLAERGRSPVRTYSGGMRRRLDIARGLMHEPEVLFLDEPTAGLDPHSRANIWTRLHELRQRQGITIFLTTHYLEEAENCGRIAVIDRGSVVAEGSPADLKSTVGDDLVCLRTADDAAAVHAVRTQLGLAAALVNHEVRVRATDGAALIPALIQAVTVPVTSVTVVKPSLDDVFLHHTGRTIGEPVGDPR
ncbi:ABC transporter ATP-binding protein [Cryptosporangium aurantiacum]|uniref:ABC-2 type transport system ATP-binding protein n=1 Tax=Cryptosporangium aurantiacum TaxID=134849 RepID=A0A1M7RNR9_9ACTN|nr:ATP-binding cassette domain-containing protein [Cryptosporangium aurantiacum]SHN47904.1 ABC-2 type transport system ATP-binding protein [Cryptosporangium aurantiacum]